MVERQLIRAAGFSYILFDIIYFIYYWSYICSSLISQMNLSLILIFAPLALV
jgi:hypothetical protein